MLPFRPSLDFSVLTLCSPDLLTVFSATFLPAAAALDAAALVLDAAFFAVDFALAVVFLAVDFALDAAFAAPFFATAANNFLEIAALRPALASPFEPALLIPAADLIPASLSFCAVAFPTPGNAIRAARGSFFGLAAISSPNPCMRQPYDEPFSFRRGKIKAKGWCERIMQERLEALSSTLYAQVRDAGPTHGYDIEGHLRPKAHPANIATVYLGDVAQTLLKVMQGASTPVMDKKPSFDEQNWTVSCRAGDVTLTIESYSYWGFGLLTRCYANTITLEGPLSERARIVFDLVASLPHKPWEFSRRGKFSSKVSNTNDNQECWMAHIERARDDLSDLIETTLLAKGDCEDIEIARNALADDNAPAVLRALARIEAESIDVEVEDVSPDGMVLKIDDDAIPFVDLSSEEE